MSDLVLKAKSLQNSTLRFADCLILLFKQNFKQLDYYLIKAEKDLFLSQVKQSSEKWATKYFLVEILVAANLHPSSDLKLHFLEIQF